MAVTLAIQPDSFTPSDNPIVWTWSSNQTGQTNFSYIVEVYIDAVLHSSHQTFPEVSTYSHFDASEILKSLTPVPAIGQATFVDDATNNREVYVIVREFYGDPLAFGASATSSTVTAFKSRIDDEDMDNWASSVYTVSTSAKKFLTDSPNTLKVREGQDYYLSIITDEVTNIGAIVEFYDVDDVQITALDYNAPTSFKITQLNLNTDIFLPTLTQPVLDTVSYIKVFYANAGSLPISETKTFYLDRGCNYGGQLLFINKYGAFDCFTFAHNLSRKADHTSKSFEKQYGGWVGIVYTLNSNDSGVQTYFKTATDKISLSSDYISEAVQNWLVKTCYISSIVYLYDNGYLKVNILSSSYSFEQDRFLESYTEIIEIGLSNTRKGLTV